MMNIAHRDKGWAAGPNNQRERFVPYFEALGEDRTLTRQSVTNLPAHNGYHSIEILKKDKSIDGEIILISAKIHFDVRFELKSKFDIFYH